MCDETLTDKDIKAIGRELLDPFEDSCVKGASYDIRVGGGVLVPSHEKGGKFTSIALGVRAGFQRSVPIPPGSTCIIQSLEKMHMPTHMKGRLALRARHARRLIFFAGGVIDPGYDDFLFLPVANLGDVPVELEYGEPLVSAEFIELNKEAAPYESSGEKTAMEGPVLFDRVRLSKEVAEHSAMLQDILSRLQSNDILLGASQRILDWVVLAAVGGGVIAVVLRLLPDLSFPWNAIAVGTGLGFGALVATVLIRARLRTR